MQALVGMIEDLLAGRPVTAMQAPAPKPTQVAGAAWGGPQVAGNNASPYGSHQPSPYNSSASTNPYASAGFGGASQQANNTWGQPQGAPAAFLNNTGGYGRGF